MLRVQSPLLAAERRRRRGADDRGVEGFDLLLPRRDQVDREAGPAATDTVDHPADVVGEVVRVRARDRRVRVADPDRHRVRVHVHRDVIGSPGRGRDHQVSDLVITDLVAHRDHPLDAVARDGAEVLHDRLGDVHTPGGRDASVHVEGARVLRTRRRVRGRGGKRRTVRRGEPGGRGLELVGDRVREEREDDGDHGGEDDEPTGRETHGGQRGTDPTAPARCVPGARARVYRSGCTFSRERRRVRDGPDPARLEPPPLP